MINDTSSVPFFPFTLRNNNAKILEKATKPSSINSRDLVTTLIKALVVDQKCWRLLVTWSLYFLFASDSIGTQLTTLRLSENELYNRHRETRSWHRLGGH